MSFFLLLNILYFEERVKPNSCWSTVTCILFFSPTIKVNVDQQLFGYPRSSKYILCAVQEITTGLGQHEWVNNDKLDFRVNYPFKDSWLHV